MANVFVSYSKADALVASRISEALKECGLSVWMDFSGLAPGKEFAVEIERQLDNATHVLVLWSKNSVRSEWVRDEADHAKRQGKLISVMIDGTELPPIGFRQRHAPSLKDWRGDARDALFRPLIDALGARVPSIGVATPVVHVQHEQPEATPPAVSAAIRLVIAALLLVFAYVRVAPFNAPWNAAGPLANKLWQLEVYAIGGLAVLAVLSALSVRNRTTLFVAMMLAFSLGVSIDNVVFAALSEAAVEFHNGTGAGVVSQISELSVEVQSAAAWQSWLIGLAAILAGLVLTFFWMRRQAWAWWLLSAGAAGAAVLEGALADQIVVGPLGEVRSSVFLLAVLAPLTLVCVSTYVAAKRGIIS